MGYRGPEVCSSLSVERRGADGASACSDSLRICEEMSKTERAVQSSEYCTEQSPTSGTKRYWHRRSRIACA